MFLHLSKGRPHLWIRAKDPIDKGLELIREVLETLGLSPMLGMGLPKEVMLLVLYELPV